MKFYHTITLLLIIPQFGLSQVILSDKDFKNLIEISCFYSNNTNLIDKEAIKKIKFYKTDRLATFVDALIEIGQGKSNLLDEKYLKRPSEDDLQFWYVLREIHYNLKDEKNKPKPNEEVAKKYLESKIDERFLIDNYYYRLRNGLAFLFNESNLSSKNINFDKLGLKSETEKAIAFFNVMSAFTQRFKVLSNLKNYPKLIEFAQKLPKINDREYFEYKSFDFDDFQWVGYDKEESYKERYIDEFYNTLISHFIAYASIGEKDKAIQIHQKSIMFEPNHFKYSKGYQSTLEQLCRQVKK